MKLTVDFPYVHRDTDRHGNERMYFRRRMGEPKIRLRARPGTVEFALEYETAKARSEEAAPRPDGPKAGTLRWLCITYFRSAEFNLLDASTQRARQRILESCLLEPIAPGAEELFADFPVKRLTGKALRV
jgi:hypothetical protein